MYKHTLGDKKLVFVDEIPVCEAQSEMGVEDFKKQVLDVVVDHTLYRDRELEILFYELRKRNLEILGEVTMDRVINELKLILDD